MKNFFLSIFTVLFVIFTFVTGAFAFPWNQWSLPDGAIARCGKGAITGNIAYSPDGKHLAVASSIGTWIYDADTGQELNLITAYPNSAHNPDGPAPLGDVLRVAYSRDGALLASAHSSIAYSVGSSYGILPGGWPLVVRVWTARTGALLRTLELEHGANSVAFGPDDTLLVPTTSLGQRARVEALSPDGTLLARAEGDGIRLLDANTGKFLGFFPDVHTGAVISVAFSPDGTRLATGGADGNVHVLDHNTRKLLRTLPVHPEGGWQSGVISVAFSPDGTLLATASGVGWHQIVHVWNVDTGKLLKTLTEHRAQGGSVAFSPDGTLLVTGSADGMSLWEGQWDVDVDTGKTRSTFVTPSLRRTLEGGGVRMSFSPDGTLLATAFTNASVQVWNVYTGQLLRLPGQLIKRPEAFKVGRHASLLSTTLLATGQGDVWNLSTGERLIGWCEGQGIGRVASSPDGTLVATGSGLNGIQVCKVDNSESIYGLHDDWLPAPEPSTGLGSLSFSSDGTLLAGGGREFKSGAAPVYVWDVHAGELLTTLTGHTGDVMSLSFSPGGTLLASGSLDRTVRLWDANTGELHRTFTAHSGSTYSGSVRSVSFSSDGTTVASAHYDVVYLWNVGVADSPPVHLPADVTGDEEVAPPDPQPVQLPADVNGDGVVDIRDIILVSAEIGKRGVNAADVNGDGVVDIRDIILVSAEIG